MTINDSATVEKDCVHKYYATLNTISTKNGYVNCSSVRLGSSILVKQSITDSLDFGIQILSYKSLTIRGLDVISYFKNTGFYFCKEF